MTRPQPHPWAAAAAEAVVERLAEVLGPNLVAAYLHGSAVLGGFDPTVSDLDLLVVCGDPLTDAAVEGICEGLGGLELPAKGLEMSIMTRSEACRPDPVRPNYQLHVAIEDGGHLRRVDGRAAAGDRDLILHLAVSRPCAHALMGPQADRILASIPEADVRQATLDEIEWARAEAPLVYLVLTAARARAFARTGRLVSKVEAGEAEAGVPVVRAALIRQHGGSATIDPAMARRYADEVAADLRRRPR